MISPLDLKPTIIGYFALVFSKYNETNIEIEKGCAVSKNVPTITSRLCIVKL